MNRLALALALLLALALPGLAHAGTGLASVRCYYSTTEYAVFKVDIRDGSSGRYIHNMYLNGASSTKPWAVNIAKWSSGDPDPVSFDGNATRSSPWPTSWDASLNFFWYNPSTWRTCYSQTLKIALGSGANSTITSWFPWPWQNIIFQLAGARQAEDDGLGFTLRDEEELLADPEAVAPMCVRPGLEEEVIRSVEDTWSAEDALLP